MSHLSSVYTFTHSIIFECITFNEQNCENMRTIVIIIVIIINCYRYMLLYV